MEQINESFKLFMKNKEFEKAEECLMKMLEMNGNNSEIFSNLGYLYYRLASQLGPYERDVEINMSKEYFSKALELNDKCTNSLNGLARLHAINGEPDKAIEYYSRSLEIKEDTITRYNMKLLLLPMSVT
jgi:tetratricopeptide (TPR) repeat protein